jgi:hypothetical protein
MKDNYIAKAVFHQSNLVLVGLSMNAESYHNLIS